MKFLRVHKILLRNLNSSFCIVIYTVNNCLLQFFCFISRRRKFTVRTSIQTAIHKKRIAMNTLCRHILIYVLFIGLAVFGTINTTWLYLTSELNGVACKIVQDFILTNVIDCFVYQIAILLLKALIYEILIMTNSSNCVRAVFFCVVSSIPWLFSIEG